SEFIAAKTALHFPQERWSDLEHRLGSAAKEFGITDIQEFIKWLLSAQLNPDEMDILVSHLAIHETYFWREPQLFEALVAQILPAIVRARENCGKCIRIWSAGCASGEEPYSIAIALHRAIPALKDWRITILATDIDPRILRQAKAGVYRKWSFRNAPPWLMEGYFDRKKDGVFAILPEIREMVTFACLNLAQDLYPTPQNNTNAMDIIFCRNVLMYFALESVKHIGLGLYRSLMEDGWLMVGASELSQFLFPQFVSVKFPGAIAYRKETKWAHLPAVFPHESPPLFQFKEDEKVLATGSQSLPPDENAAVFEQAAPASGLEPLEITEAETLPDKAHLIRALADQGKPNEALALCAEALAANKLDPGLHFLQASILQELDRIDEACVSLKRTLYLDQNFLLAHFALGNLGLRQGNKRAAKKHFENVLALLKGNRTEDILPEAEWLTAGRFREIILATMATGALA
ncbi:MAG: chemotaxis protein CheR, partial [Candidatus Aminicenantes bacterium]|nr:chemotaxis protein CheR [Candidatus Aminicenantes bacterium]